MDCLRCERNATRRDGQTRRGGQRWRCNACHRRFTARSSSACSHHAFPDDVIALAIRHSVRYRLSDADVVAWFAERGLVINRSTIERWVQRFLPLFGEAARVHRQPVGKTWRVDELDVRLKGTWTSIERAIDQHGHVVDTYCSKRRNATAAETFFKHAVSETDVMPTRVVTDKATCYPPALRRVLPHVEHRHSRYLNNGIERDHGHLKQRLSPMRGVKSERAAAVLSRGHALVQHLRNAFSHLTTGVSRNLRLARAWSQLAQAI